MGPRSVPRASSSGDFGSVNGDYVLKSNGLKQASSTANTTIYPQHYNSMRKDFINEHDIALHGNGNDQDLSEDQLELIRQLYDNVEPLRKALHHPHDAEFCDYETCRRYLVARQWSLQRAQDQLTSTLEWRIQENPGEKEFWQSSKSLKNPLALNMRCVGWTSDGRPILYTCFREAHDRWDVDANMEQVLLLLEATAKLLQRRRKRGWNQTAFTRQSVWVIDFDGFNSRDCNPRSAVATANLLQHYPEMLNMVVLLDAPLIFNGLWKLLTPLLDERVRSKVMFVKGKDAANLLQERLGHEAAKWIADETTDNREKMQEAKKGNPKRYWIPPTDPSRHDARGMSSYIHSPLYIKTPGDAHEERRKGAQTTTRNDNALEETKKNLLEEFSKSNVTVKVTFIYKGTF